MNHHTLQIGKIDPCSGLGARVGGSNEVWQTTTLEYLWLGRTLLSPEKGTIQI
jgi:hypothetical protein